MQKEKPNNQNKPGGVEKRRLYHCPQLLLKEMGQGIRGRPYRTLSGTAYLLP